MPHNLPRPPAAVKPLRPFPSLQFIAGKEKLVERFNYWTSWYDTSKPWKRRELVDDQLFEAYGLSLAIDLKRVLGHDYYIEFRRREIHDDCEFLQNQRSSHDA